jgi:hypothetical protein
MRNEGSIEMWRAHEQQESKGLAMSQFPSARRFATTANRRSARQKPAWLWAPRRCDDRDDPFLSYPREKGKRENGQGQSWTATVIPSAVIAESASRSSRRRGANDYNQLRATILVAGS